MQAPDTQCDPGPRPPHLAEVIQFTNSKNCVARPEVEPLGLDRDILYVSSETEDSDDYNKALGGRSAPEAAKTKRSCRARAGLGCRVCNLNLQVS